MATINSAQTGNFSSTSTWSGGVLPGDGDTFNILASHTVTIDTNQQPTNGFADSNISGILTNANNTALRMNGRLKVLSGGTLHLKDTFLMQFKGSDADDHGFQIDNTSNADVIIEGDDGMPCTTLASAAIENVTSLSFTSAAEFSVGDWFAVFDNTTAFTSNANTVGTPEWRDEGFIVHEKDGNTVYFRHFVTPDDVTVSSFSGTRVFLSNIKKFRKGDYVIFGTGSNRNVGKIANINYGRGFFTFDSSVTGNPAGQTVYLTGTQKNHISGSKVRKVATTVASEAASGQTTVVLTDASGFGNNDEIYIQDVSESGGTTDYADAKDVDYTISSISTNTLTLSSNTNNKILAGSFVTRLSRSIRFEALTPGTDKFSFFINHRSTYDRSLVLKDVYFKDCGDDNSNTRQGCVIRGYFSNDDADIDVTPTQTWPYRSFGPWLEGIVVKNYPDDAWNRDWGNIWLYDARDSILRCSTALYGNDGIAGHYEPRQGFLNNISANHAGFACRIEGMTDMWEVAYNLFSRSNNRARIFTTYEPGLGVHHNRMDALFYAFETGYQSNASCWYMNKFTGLRYGHYGAVQQNATVLRSETKFLSGLVNHEAGTGTAQAGVYQHSHRRRGHGGNRGVVYSIEHNGEYDAIRAYGYNWEASWDNGDQAWYFTRRYDNDNNPSFQDCIYLPGGTTLRVTAKVKLVPGFSGTKPRIFVEDTKENMTENVVGNSVAFSTIFSTESGNNSAYGTASETGYEEKQMTLTATDWPRAINFGVYSSNRDAAEGFYIKDLRALIDTPYPLPQAQVVNAIGSTGLSSVSIRNTFSEQKKRLGGRIR